MPLRNFWTPKVPDGIGELNASLWEMGFMPDPKAGPSNLYDMQRRWIEAKRHIREHRVWILTLLSALASVLSAATALVAVISALARWPG